MALIERIELGLEALRIARYGTEPRPLTDDDRQSWIDAAQRDKPQMPRTRDAVRTGLKRVNPVRFRQLEGDIKWAKKHLGRMGINPEDWRSFL